MEEIEGMFSSPDSSSVGPNGFHNGNETAGSDGMSTDGSKFQVFSSY